MLTELNISFLPAPEIMRKDHSACDDCTEQDDGGGGGEAKDVSTLVLVN
jgi:hypothetical protein